MKKPELKDFTTKNAEGVETTNYVEYGKAMESYADARANEAAETAKQKGILEGKTKAEEEAKLTAEEKANKAIKEKEEAFAKRELEFNQREFSASLKSGGYSEDEIKTLINLCGSDNTKNKASVDSLVAARKVANEALIKEIKSGIQGGQPVPKTGDGKTKNVEDNYGAKLGKIKANEMTKNGDADPFEYYTNNSK